MCRKGSGRIQTGYLSGIVVKDRNQAGFLDPALFIPREVSRILKADHT